MVEKYEVIKPWHGVAKGDVVELKTIHPSLKSHVRKLSDKAASTLTPATPDAATDVKYRKEAISARLSELGIEFDGRKGVDDLSTLLPEGELEKLFPSE